MTITVTSTELRSAQPHEATLLAPEDVPAAPRGRSNQSSPNRSASRRTWTWVDVEDDVEPTRAPFRWLTLFARAKVAGGW